MSSSRFSLPSAASLPVVQQPRSLFVRGLEHLRQQSGEVWTDHNLHDPGITFLEAYCEGLADLAYRASLPLPDLLHAGLPTGQTLAECFWTAQQILHTRPTTDADFRKLMVDVPGVQNAWLKPVALTYYADAKRQGLQHAASNDAVPVAIQGVYQPLLELAGRPTATQRRALQAAVFAALQANRNLCQDFLLPQEVAVAGFSVCAEIELQPQADTAKVAAAMRYALEQHFAPPIRRASLQELLAEGMVAEDIYQGPRLMHGFIRDADLAASALRSELRLSDIIAVLMNLPGVVAVRRIHLGGAAPAEAERARSLVDPLKSSWRVPVPDGHQARLSMAGSRWVFYKRQVPVTADPDAVQAAYEALLAAQTAAAARCEDLPIPTGTAAAVADYPPVQAQLPALYGTGPSGFVSGSSAIEQAQVMQLKAYLHLFDQVLANDCAQLAHLPKLYSRDAAQTRATAIQPLHYLMVERILDATTAEALAELMETEADQARHLARRHQAVDHLLARLGEDFSSYAHINASLFGTGSDALLADKCRFLQDAPSAGADRGGGYRQFAPEATLWNSAANLSGLELRIARLLGLKNPARRNLSRLATDIYAQIDSTPDNQFRFRIKHRDSGKIMLSADSYSATRELAEAAMATAIARAQVDAAYQRRTTRDGRAYFNILGEEGNVVARRIEYFSSEALREVAIAELKDYLRSNYDEEGFYLIENLLLRPEPSGVPDALAEPFLDFCNNAECSGDGQYDPYSYRLHFILPAYAGRFAQYDFRLWAEQVIREQTPAHLIPKICWVERDAMQALERAWRRWLLVAAGHVTGRDARAEALAALKAALQSSKNSYPPSRLRDCVGEQDKFILGRNALARGPAA